MSTASTASDRLSYEQLQLELPLMVEDSTHRERELRGCTILETVATAAAVGSREGLPSRVTRLAA